MQDSKNPARVETWLAAPSPAPVVALGGLIGGACAPLWALGLPPVAAEGLWREVPVMPPPGGSVGLSWSGGLPPGCPAGGPGRKAHGSAGPLDAPYGVLGDQMTEETTWDH